MKYMKVILATTFIFFGVITSFLEFNSVQATESIADSDKVEGLESSTSVKMDASSTNRNVITKGVYVDGIHLEGMTKEEALETIKTYVNELKKKKVTLDFNGVQEVISLEDLEYTFEENTFIDQVLEIGTSGNLIKRYKERKDVENNNLSYDLVYSINEDKLTEFIIKGSEKHNIPAVNATMSRVNGEFVYTKEEEGIIVLEEQTRGEIHDSIFLDWNQEDIYVKATMEIEEPLYDLDTVKMATDKLGSFTTTYTSSSSDRAGNLANGAKLINNTLLYPGEVFSAYEKLTPFTTANGYFEAGSYANGKVVDSIGGGACQVTTTLYNALLYAELEIVERAAHSMTISYADLSRDAAIAGTWKDLKFRNDKEVPILIEVFTKGRTITFNIWGYENRPESRTFQFESEILKEVMPGEDVITEDETKPVSYRVTTQSPHIGYTSQLIKVVYEDGQEVERIRVNKSTYLAAPRYVTIGTMVEEIEPVEEDSFDAWEIQDETPIEEATKVEEIGSNSVDLPEETLEETNYGDNGV